MLYKSFSEISEDDTNSIPSSSLRCETRQLVSGALVLVCVKAINQSVSQSVNQSVSQSKCAALSTYIFAGNSYLYFPGKSETYHVFKAAIKLMKYLTRITNQCSRSGIYHSFIIVSACVHS